MKKNSFSLLVLSFLMATLCSWSSAQAQNCLEDQGDRGECDTLNVICVDCNQPDTGSNYFIRFPLLVTHDISDPATDSIAGMQLPLCYTHTHPTNYCSLSSYWNKTSLVGVTLPQSIFRHLVIGSDTVHNWVLNLYEQDPSYVWSNIILNLDGTSHFWLCLIPTVQPLFGAESNALIATMTFRIEDTTHVCIDSCFWPPSSSLAFSRSDGQTYVPRTNLPHCFWIGPPRLQVTSPNGGENWGEGTTHDITWLSENFSGANIKIDYTIDSGTNWLPVVNSASNSGSFPWVIPSNPSANCRVKISDEADGGPYDISDADFSIVQPDFTIEADPDTRIVEAGQSTNYHVMLTSLFGFNSPCTLSVTGLPPKASAYFDRNPVIPTDTSVMAVTTAEITSPGTYNVTVTATEMPKAQIQHSTTVVLVITSSFFEEALQDTESVPGGQPGGEHCSRCIVDTCQTLYPPMVTAMAME